MTDERKKPNTTLEQLSYDGSRPGMPGRGGPWGTEQVEVTQLEPNLFRLVQTAVFLDGDGKFLNEDLQLGTVFEAKRDDKGVLQITKIVKQSHFDVLDVDTEPGYEDSPRFKVFCDRLQEAGGQWELIFGSSLRVYLPAGSNFDVETERCAMFEPHLGRIMVMENDGQGRIALNDSTAWRIDPAHKVRLFSDWILSAVDPSANRYTMKSEDTGEVIDLEFLGKPQKIPSRNIRPITSRPGSGITDETDPAADPA